MYLYVIGSQEGRWDSNIWLLLYYVSYGLNLKGLFIVFFLEEYNQIKDCEHCFRNLTTFLLDMCNKIIMMNNVIKFYLSV